MAKPHTEGRLYTITQLSEELGVTPRAIRFYEIKGLVDPQRVGANRVYTYRDRARLLIILRGKRLGFTLAGIQQYLDLYDADPTHKEQLVVLLRGARERIGELEAQRRDLEQTLVELHDVEAQVLQAMAAAGIDPPPTEPPTSRPAAGKGRGSRPARARSNRKEPA